MLFGDYKMATQFNVLVGLIRTYHVLEGWDNLTLAQKEMVNEQGWYCDDFPIPKWEKFWDIDGVIFSTEMDLIDLGVFAFDGWHYQYSVGGEDFVCRFVGFDRDIIEVAKVIVEVKP